MTFIPTIEIKDLFKQACYHKRPLVYLRALRIFGHNKQLTANSIFVQHNTQIKDICGYCNDKIDQSDFDYFAGYWQPNMWRPVHKKCKEAYRSEEVIDCQTADADCNDCKHYKREMATNKNTSKGLCLKFNKPTIANVNFATGHKCFEHRKS